MEFAVYRIYYHADGRKMGSFVNMYPSCEQAEVRAQGLTGEHEVVRLMTREIAEGDDFGTVVFLEGGVEPGGAAETGREE